MSVNSSLARENKREPAGGGGGAPFSAGSAVNGASLDALGRVVLGQLPGAIGNPAIFLGNRVLPMDGFFFEMLDGSFSQFLVNPTLGQYFFGDIGGQVNGNFLNIDDTIQEWSIGQRTAVTNLLLNKPSAGIGLSFFDSMGTNPFLVPDPGTGGIASLNAPDFTTAVSLSDQGNGGLAILGDVAGSANGAKFRANTATGILDWGDPDNLTSGIKAEMDLVAQTFQIINNLGEQFLFLNLTPGGEGAILGKLDAASSGARFSVSSATGFQRFIMESDGPDQIPMDFDPVAAIYKLGDTFNHINQTVFEIDVNAQRFKFSVNGGGAVLQVDGNDGVTGSFLNPTQIQVQGGIVTSVT